MSDFPHALTVTFRDGWHRTYRVSADVARRFMGADNLRSFAGSGATSFYHAAGFTLLHYGDVRAVEIPDPPSFEAVQAGAPPHDAPQPPPEPPP